jgi:hypothetical protein
VTKATGAVLKALTMAAPANCSAAQSEKGVPLPVTAEPMITRNPLIRTVSAVGPGRK